MRAIFLHFILPFAVLLFLAWVGRRRADDATDTSCPATLSGTATFDEGKEQP